MKIKEPNVSISLTTCGLARRNITETELKKKATRTNNKKYKSKS
jgi:hypothetical protein